MSRAVVEVGDKLHVITRRLFEEDIRRHFVGEIAAISGALVELQGHAFVLNPSTNEYRRLPEVRTRILSLDDSGHVVNKIPLTVDLAAVRYRVVDQHLVVTDGTFSLAINEFGPRS